MHSYIRDVCLVVDIVLRQMCMSLALNHQENIDTYILKNKEKNHIYIYYSDVR